MWEIDRFWFREPFGTDGIFWKFEFRIYFWQVFFFTASCWTATTQYSRNRIFKFVEIEVVVTCLVAIGVQTNCLTCLAKRGLTGKQHFHSYLNRGPSGQKLTSSLKKLHLFKMLVGRTFNVSMETILEDNTTDHMSFIWRCKGTPRGGPCPKFWHFFQCIFGQ